MLRIGPLLRVAAHDRAPPPPPFAVVLLFPVSLSIVSLSRQIARAHESGRRRRLNLLKLLNNKQREKTLVCVVKLLCL